MSSLKLEALAKKIRFDTDNLWIELLDGRQLAVPLAYFPLLISLGWLKPQLLSGKTT